jgi:hypothetical protein
MYWRRDNPENQAKSRQWAPSGDKAGLFLARNPLGNRFECIFDFPRRVAPLKVRPPILLSDRLLEINSFKQQAV